jgi:hypothetical protein
MADKSDTARKIIRVRAKFVVNRGELVGEAVRLVV